MTSHPHRSFLNNTSSYYYQQICYILLGSSKGSAAALQLQLHALHKVTDENFKINLQVLQLLTPKFQSKSSALCERGHQRIASGTSM